MNTYIATTAIRWSSTSSSSSPTCFTPAVVSHPIIILWQFFWFDFDGYKLKLEQIFFDFFGLIHSTYNRYVIHKIWSHATRNTIKFSPAPRCLPSHTPSSDPSISPSLNPSPSPNPTPSSIPSSSTLPSPSSTSHQLFQVAPSANSYFSSFNQC